MVKYIRSIHDFSFSALQLVYADSITARARVLRPEDWDTEGLLLAQQELYQYFREAFFSDGKSFCAALCSGDKYVSILRMEPYKNDWLLTGLETAPNERNRGNAAFLMGTVLDDCKKHGINAVYTHVYKNNPVSLHLHESLGFVRISDGAKFLDGSFSSDAYTLLWTYK